MMYDDIANSTSRLNLLASSERTRSGCVPDHNPCHWLINTTKGGFLTEQIPTRTFGNDWCSSAGPLTPRS